MINDKEVSPELKKARDRNHLIELLRSLDANASPDQKRLIADLADQVMGRDPWQAKKNREDVK